jgi:hypothetical protein
VVAVFVVWLSVRSLLLHPVKKNDDTVMQTEKQNQAVEYRLPFRLGSY